MQAMDSEEVTEQQNVTQDRILDLLLYLNSRYNNNSNVSTLESLSKQTFRDGIIIACYSVVVVVSIFGNLLVCNIVARKASMRRTTYVFIANLAVSDLLMTVLNIPFTVVRVLLKHWPFGSFMCSFVPLVQVTSVYVSTFTMMFIALDRYRVICKPLMPRISPLQALRIIIFIWMVSIVLSLPHAVFNRIETVYSYMPLVRCRTRCPKKLCLWITITTVLTQYIVPLSVTGYAYFFIVARVWSRDVLGVVTEAQFIRQAKAKRKTIKMLLVVVILFTLCWLPLNVYNLVNEFSRLQTSLTPWFICHWVAMSSVCYNPFIYCWLNKSFRSGAITCFECIRNVGQKLNSSFRSTREDTRCNFHSQSFDGSTSDGLQTSKNTSCLCKTIKSHQHVRHDSITLRTGSQKNSNIECVPMKSITTPKCSNNNSTCVFAENYRTQYCSVPEMENMDLVPKRNIKKCLSWSP